MLIEPILRTKLIYTKQKFVYKCCTGAENEIEIEQGKPIGCSVLRACGIECEKFRLDKVQNWISFI